MGAPLHIDVITVFPELFDTHLSTSLLGKAITAEKLSVQVHDLREHGLGKHRSVDDEPYGGGAGMVMRPEPLFAAVEPLVREGSRVIVMSPRGRVFDHGIASEMATAGHLVLVCGRYEGIDQRVIDGLGAEELSIGDFVLAGGELAAQVVIEAVSRLLPGVLGNESSLASESHAARRLEYPQYTRPAEFRGMKVPDVLLSGHHAEVEKWRAAESEELTRSRRPDLLDPDERTSNG
jgi:tRNA (guanine37-N1)-methyltransferase